MKYFKFKDIILTKNLWESKKEDLWKNSVTKTGKRQTLNYFL